MRNASNVRLLTLLRRRSYEVKKEEFIIRRAVTENPRPCLSRLGRITGTPLQEHQGRLFNEFPDFHEELCAKDAIDDTVVAGEAKIDA